MKVVLKEDIEKLGNFGDRVDVSDGYARNYLIPKGMAWPARDKYIKRIESLRRKKEDEKAKLKEAALEKAGKIKDLSLTIEVEAGEEDKLFGSVTSMDIEEKIKESGIEIDRKDIQIKEPIKKLGVYKITVRLHPEVEETCKVWVVRK